MYTTIQYQESDDRSIVTLRLNRPDKLNAMTIELITELYEALCKIEEDRTCRVVILIGNGRGFCAGADLAANSLGVGGQKWDSSKIANQKLFSRVPLKIASMPQVVIAAVHGACAGGGFSLALAADMRIAGESTKMNAAFIKIGLGGCEMGISHTLPKMVGYANASEILMTGDMVNAEKAYRLGIVNKVVADDQIHKEALDLARRCTQASSLGLRLTKAQLRGSADGMSMQTAVHAEDVSQVLCLNDEDVKEYLKEKVKKFFPSKGKL
mmetsp:Transcript_13294/g.21719  ORF Transcript_13294/g.21719 Transcript_13294/m.21719 type:complete len:268 (+) Transcript_13294:79-882(+)